MKKSSLFSVPFGIFATAGKLLYAGRREGALPETVYDVRRVEKLEAVPGPRQRLDGCVFPIIRCPVPQLQ